MDLHVATVLGTRSPRALDGDAAEHGAWLEEPSATLQSDLAMLLEQGRPVFVRLRSVEHCKAICARGRSAIGRAEPGSAPLVRQAIEGDEVVIPLHAGIARPRNPATGRVNKRARGRWTVHRSIVVSRDRPVNVSVQDAIQLLDPDRFGYLVEQVDPFAPEPEPAPKPKRKRKTTTTTSRKKSPPKPRKRKSAAAAEDVAATDTE